MRSATSCLAALALAAVFRLAVADTAWEGRKLSDYLDFLNSQGSRVIYTSDLVANHMLLSREPAGDASADGLADLLHAFGLTVTAGPADSLLVVRLPSEVEAASRPAAPEDVAIPEIIVTSSLHRLDYSPPLTHPREITFAAARSTRCCFCSTVSGFTSPGTSRISRRSRRS
jgi:hypothetical protein